MQTDAEILIPLNDRQHAQLTEIARKEGVSLEDAPELIVDAAISRMMQDLLGPVSPSQGDNVLLFCRKSPS